MLCEGVFISCSHYLASNCGPLLPRSGAIPRHRATEVNKMPEEPRDVAGGGRRSFLKWATAVSAFGAAALAGLPSLRAFFSPSFKKPEGKRWVKLGEADLFDVKTGAVLAGPPPRPLDTLEWKVEDGMLYCAYQDFRVGIAQKVSV